jgi:hypothetical protein
VRGDATGAKRRSSPDPDIDVQNGIGTPADGLIAALAKG